MQKISELEREVKAAHYLWDLFSRAVRRAPFRSGFFLFIVLLVFVDQCYRTVTERLEGLQSPEKARWIMGVVVVVAVVAVTIVVLIRRKYRPVIEIISPGPGDPVIGGAFIAEWEISGEDPTDDFEDVQFVVEERKSETQASREVYRLRKSGHHWKPAASSFQWRVRAVRDNSDVTRWSSWQPNTHYPSALDRIQETKAIRIGVIKDDEPPYSYYDTDREKDTGICLEAARVISEALGDRLGFEPAITFHPNEWLEGTSRDLRQRVTDFAVITASNQEDRARQYRIAFSAPYMNSFMSVIYRQQDGPLRLADLKDRRVTSWPGTVGEDIARAVGASFVAHANYGLMFRKLDDNDVVAIIDAQHVARYHVRQWGAGYATTVIQPDELDELVENWSGQYPLDVGAWVHDGEGPLLELLNDVISDNQTRSKLMAILEPWQ